MADNLNTPLVKATGSESELQPTAGAISTGIHTDTVSNTELAAGRGHDLDLDHTRVELLAEQVDVQKQERQAGEVQISKRVVEEKVMVPVTLRREEVTMTRTKSQSLPDPILAQNEGVFKDETIIIVLHEEVPVITKTTRVAEIIEVQKRVTTETKSISESVRHEEVDINQGTTGRVTIEDARNSTL